MQSKLSMNHPGVQFCWEMSPTLFNIYLEYIMMEALDGFEGSVSIGGRTVSNLWFADDIDLVAEQAEELSTLTRRLEESAKTAWHAD